MPDQTPPKRTPFRLNSAGPDKAHSQLRHDPIQQLQDEAEANTKAVEDALRTPKTSS